MQTRYTYVNKDNVYIVDSVIVKKDRVHLMKMITLFIHCYRGQACTGIYIYTSIYNPCRSCEIYQIASSTGAGFPTLQVLLLIEEIPNNHLGCIKPCK